MLRAVIATIPPDKRESALAQARDLLPVKLLGVPNAPKRGGNVLNNVFELFARDPKVVRAAPAVKDELAKAGKNADIQTVRNALTYLQGRSVLSRVGYGLYRLNDGSLKEGPP